MTSGAEIALALVLASLALFNVFVIVPWLKRRRVRRELRDSLRGYRDRLRDPQTRESLGKSQRIRVRGRRP